MILKEKFMSVGYRFILAFSALSVISCKIDLKNDNNTAYIGGEIINAKNDRVILLNTSGKIFDTIVLDSDNRFIHKIEHLESGLYSITHGGEYQMVLLEPNDSIMFRLNTQDFDESLVFTGKGAKKNNYLIKTYLTNEAEAKKLMNYSQMEPEAFNEFIERRRKKRLHEFHEFYTRTNGSPFFKSVIEANINYNAYADKEIYPFAYFGNNKLVHVKDLPDDFYAYRNTIDYNATYLSNFFSYNRFLFSHFDNLALKAYYKNNPYHSAFDRHSMCYNMAKLDLIDSLITDATIKNNLLKYKVRDFISHNYTDEKAIEMLNYFITKTSNDEDKAYMKSMVSSLKSLEIGKSIPEIKLINYNNEEHDLSTTITKPSIIYFWSANLKSQYRNSHYKVKQLKAKFPQVDFISININSDDKFWKKAIETYDFPKVREFRFENSKTALKTLAINYLNKAIIVNANGKILHPNINIYDEDFETSLTEIIAQN